MFVKLHQVKQRKWLGQRGKSGVLEFADDELKKLMECFNQLDEDGSGSIGIDELEAPLIGLGFASTRSQVQKLIDEVDEDQTGAVEFKEFLSIIRNASNQNNKSNTYGVDKFFKDMAHGKVGNKELSFGINVQNIRRTYMVDALMNRYNQSPENKLDEKYESKCNNILSNVAVQRIRNEIMEKRQMA